MEKLFWIDLEMTGLDVEREVIIECAAIITDMDFNPIDQYEAVIQQPQWYLDHMDDWNQKQHGKSGLTAKVPSGKNSFEVEKDLIQLTQRHFSQEKAVLAGNSIGQDRLFINKYWPELAQKLHYRMLDVTSLKLIMKHKFNLEYSKQGSHRALDDIQESINELKYYLEMCFK